MGLNLLQAKGVFCFLGEQSRVGTLSNRVLKEEQLVICFQKGFPISRRGFWAINSNPVALKTFVGLGWMSGLGPACRPAWALCPLSQLPLTARIGPCATSHNPMSPQGVACCFPGLRAPPLAPVLPPLVSSCRIQAHTASSQPLQAWIGSQTHQSNMLSRSQGSP